uniref:KIAA1614 n=1 Tax=Catagonus wagneri TaxID=51154 RepID=A0A8C3WZ18_9CETA
MEGTEAAARPARGSLQGPQIGIRTASSMEVTSAVERSGPEPQPENGHLPRHWPCPGEDRTPSLMAPQPPRVWGTQLQGPSVLESKVRALKEKMTAGKQGASPCLASHEQPSLRKPKCRRVKMGGTRAPAEGSCLPDAGTVLRAQNHNGRPLDGGVTEESARNGGPRTPRSPAPGLECWNRRSPWPPEVLQTLPDRDRALPPGPGSVQDSPTHRATPGGSSSCHKVAYMAKLRKGRSHPVQDGPVTQGDQDSLSLTSEEDSVPRPVLPGELWRAGDPGRGTLSLSDRVERNRLLLQEMLSAGGQGPSKVGIPAWTASWDTATPEHLAGNTIWDSGISLQDADQGRDGRKSPALDPRTAFACRDNLQNGNTSDSSSGESSSGQRPKRSASPSHVRFEDESARDAQSRYLERLQQRQRQVLGTALQPADQGPLRSKPDLANYIYGGCWRRDAGAGSLHPLLGSLEPRGLPTPPPALGSERRCQACGHCVTPDPGVLWEPRAAHRVEELLPQPLLSRGSRATLRLLPAEPGLRTEWIRETHIGNQARPEEVDSALDSTDTSDSCRTDSEEAGGAQPSRARGSSARVRASRPRGSHRWFCKAAMEPPQSPGAPHSLPGLELVEVSGEAVEGTEHMPEGTLLPREDAVSKPPVQDSERTLLGSQGQPEPGLENHWAHPEDSWAACAVASSKKLGSSGPDGQAQVTESHPSLGTVSQHQSHTEPSAPHQAQQPPAPLSPEGWKPTPPSAKKTASPVSHRKAALAGLRRPGDQGEPVDISLPPSRSGVPRTYELTPPQPPLRSPHIRHPLRALSNNNCNSTPQVPQEPWGGSVLEDQGQEEPEAAPKDCREGGLQGCSSAAVGTLSSVGVTFLLASEEPGSSQQPEGDLRRTEPSSTGPVSSRALLGLSARAGPPSAAPPDKNKKSGGSLASTLGLKKLFLALSQGPRPRPGKSRSGSVEQLQPPAPGLAPHASAPKVKRAPSFQSLRLVSPSRQHRKAASLQNLHSLLGGKVDRSNLYLVEEPGDPRAAGRPAKAPPRRALSVQDVSAPGLARAVGRVVEVFPDGTCQLQLQRSPEGTFGFRVASGNGRRDSGFYVQEMADESTAKLYAGLLGLGDEILEVNGAKVAGLGLAHMRELLAHAESLSIRVLRQRPVPR